MSSNLQFSELPDDIIDLVLPPIPERFRFRILSRRIQKFIDNAVTSLRFNQSTPGNILSQFPNLESVHLRTLNDKWSTALKVRFDTKQAPIDRSSKLLELEFDDVTLSVSSMIELVTSHGHLKRLWNNSTKSHRSLPYLRALSQCRDLQTVKEPSLSNPYTYMEEYDEATRISFPSAREVETDNISPCLFPSLESLTVHSGVLRGDFPTTAINLRSLTVLAKPRLEDPVNILGMFPLLEQLNFPTCFLQRFGPSPHLRVLRVQSIANWEEGCFEGTPLLQELSLLNQSHICRSRLAEWPSMQTCTALHTLTLNFWDHPHPSEVSLSSIRHLSVHGTLWEDGKPWMRFFDKLDTLCVNLNELRLGDRIEMLNSLPPTLQSLTVDCRETVVWSRFRQPLPALNKFYCVDPPGHINFIPTYMPNLTVLHLGPEHEQSIYKGNKAKEHALPRDTPPTRDTDAFETVEVLSGCEKLRDLRLFGESYLYQLDDLANVERMFPDLQSLEISILCFSKTGKEVSEFYHSRLRRLVLYTHLLSVNDDFKVVFQAVQRCKIPRVAVYQGRLVNAVPDIEKRPKYGGKFKTRSPDLHHNKWQVTGGKKESNCSLQ